ncbi:hypothetical protein ANN_07701 [Periplaneta americana]|uniref:Transposase Tc1-like domain-containing protein n=1 Tax=Periplaneta americana TaxID=6978 RepID=A0ABQ8SZF4_PERAM|nr:hypothetical protein ANN_07701 [Periplaneta americana]
MGDCMCELKKLVRESATVARGRHTFYQVLYQKIAIAHQTTHLGLEAYYHHMPSSVKGAASEKLRDLLNLTIDLMKICNKLGVPPPEMTSAPQVIEKKVKIMITLITVPTTTISLDNFEDNLPTSRTVTASMMTTTGCRDWESCLRTAERKVPTTSSKDAYSVNSIPWRERATRLARAIYGSPLKKKNSTLKKVVGSKTIKKPTNALKSTLTESYKNMDTVKKSPAAPLPSPPFPASPLPEKKATSKLHNMEEVKCGDNIRTAVESFPLDVQVQEEDPHQKRCTETKKCDSTSHLVEHISSKVLDRCAKELRNNFETYMTGIVDNIDEMRPEDVARAVALYDDGCSVRYIANVMNMARSTTHDAIKRYTEILEYTRRPCSGRPRATNPNEDRYMVLRVLRERNLPATSVAQQFVNMHGRPVSAKTVRRRLKASGLISSRPATGPRLLRMHRVERLRFANDHRDWRNGQWSCVLFTDESRFNLCSPDGRERVWRRRGERFSQCCISENVPYGGGGVMVWAGVCTDARTELVFVENGRLTADRYINDHVVPFGQFVGAYCPCGRRLSARSGNPCSSMASKESRHEHV